MAVTILEGLQNAKFNLSSIPKVGSGILPLGYSQLHNAVTLLEKGYSIDDEVEPLLEEFGEVENVPEKE